MERVQHMSGAGIRRNMRQSGSVSGRKRGRVARRESKEMNRCRQRGSKCGYDITFGKCLLRERSVDRAIIATAYNRDKARSTTTFFTNGKGNGDENDTLESEEDTYSSLGFIQRLSAAFRILFPSELNVIGSPETKVQGSGVIAKRRLKMLLYADRLAQLDSETTDLIQTKVVETLSEFVDINTEESVNTSITSDSTVGTILTVSVPVLRVSTRRSAFTIISILANLCQVLQHQKLSRLCMFSNFLHIYFLKVKEVVKFTEDQAYLDDSFGPERYALYCLTTHNACQTCLYDFCSETCFIVYIYVCCALCFLFGWICHICESYGYDRRRTDMVYGSIEWEDEEDKSDNMDGANDVDDSSTIMKDSVIDSDNES